MFAKIRAVSAEGRMSAIVISAMPLVVFAIVNLISPNYFGEVLTDPWFLPMMGVGTALLLLGQIIIWKMVNFRF
jgi:tight adherence protein B